MRTLLYCFHTIKFTLLTITFLLVATSPISSQSGLAFSGGGNFANLENSEMSDDYKSETNTGLGGGIRLDFDIDESGYFKLSPEFFFQKKGSNEYIQNFQELNFGQIDLSYFGAYFPLTFYIPFGEKSEDAYNGFLIQTKIYGDYVVSGNQIKDNSTVPITFGATKDKIDFGYSIEAGFVTAISPDPSYPSFQLMIGFNKGIKSIDFLDSYNTNQQFTAINKGLYISAGFAQKLNND